MNLSTERDQLSRALESVSFDEDKLLAILAKAKAAKVAQLGTFPEEEDDCPVRIHVIVMYEDDVFAQLSITVLTQPGSGLIYTAALRAKDGTVLTSNHYHTRSGAVIEMIPLARPGILIGAQLYLSI